MFVKKSNNIRDCLLISILIFAVFLIGGIKVNADSVSVNSWSELETKMSDSTVDEINVTGDVIADKTIKINKDVTLNFNKHLVTIKTGSGAFEVASSAHVLVKNVEVYGAAKMVGSETTYDKLLFKGSGEVRMTGSLTSGPENTAKVAKLKGGTVILDGIDMTYDKEIPPLVVGKDEKIYDYESIFSAKNFTITNKSKVTANVESFFRTVVDQSDAKGVTSISNDDATIIIDKQSQVNTIALTKAEMKLGAYRAIAWGLHGKSQFYVRDKGTQVNVQSDAKTIMGIMELLGEDSSINVENEATLNIKTEHSSCLQILSKGGSVNVRDHVNLILEQEDDDNDQMTATIRFRNMGYMSFNVEDNSKFTVTKNRGNVPTIRMYGVHNEINVRGNSDFIVKNKGDAERPQTILNYLAQGQGVLFIKNRASDRGPFTFNLEGEGSNVNIEADRGPAIDSANSASTDEESKLNIVSEKGTYFIARGVTQEFKSREDGIFTSGIGMMDTRINQPRYFDFANYSKGATFSNGEKSIMTSVGTDLSVWKKDADLSGDPFDSWWLIDYKLSGKNFDKIDSSNEPLFMSNYGKTSDYSRMTANNQSPKIKDIRVPTNADKYIYVKVEVPEGKYESDRPAYDDEVAVRLGLYDVDGTEIKEYITRTSTETIYGKEDQKGIVKVKVPDGKFIKEGMKVKVLSAWRGNGDEDSVKVHKSSPEDILVKEVTAIDVTPPNTIKLDKKNISNSVKRLSGTSDQNSAKVFLKKNDEWLRDTQGNLVTASVTDNKWQLTLPKNLSQNDKIEIFLKEDVVIDESTLNYELPDTYTKEPNNEWGNLNVSAVNYDKYKGYHDAVGKERFAPSLITEVSDVEPPTPEVKKIARSLTKDKEGNQIPQTSDGKPAKPNEWEGTATKVNNTLSYRVVVQIPGKTGEDQEKVLYNANIVDKIPESLTFQKEDVKVWKYTKGDSDGFPIRYETNQVGEDGKHTQNMGDIDLDKSNATKLDNAIVDYQESTRLLTVGIGDTSKNVNDKYSEYGYDGDNKYGFLLPGDKVVIEFPTLVTRESANVKLINSATISGFSGSADPEDPTKYKEIKVKSNEVVNEVKGELSLKSAPSEIKFADMNISDYNTFVTPEKITQNLVVKDTIKDQDWKVTAKLTEDMTFEKDNKKYTLPNSLYMRRKSENVPEVFKLNAPVLIYQSDLTKDEHKTKDEFVLSDDWGTGLDDSGFKLKASQLPRAGKYEGTLEWALENTE